MTRRLTTDQVTIQIANEARRAGSISKLAVEWGLSKVYLSLVIRGVKDIGPTICKRLGLRRVQTVETWFEKVK